MHEGSTGANPQSNPQSMRCPDARAPPSGLTTLRDHFYREIQAVRPIGPPAGDDDAEGMLRSLGGAKENVATGCVCEARS